MNRPIAVPVAIVKTGSITPVNYQIKASGYICFKHNTYNRISRAGLELLAKRQLSPRDLAILRTVLELKLVSAHQIQRLHFPDYLYNSNIAAQRLCNRSLQRLTNNGILKRSERRIGGFNGGSRSYIYGLGANGAKLSGKNPRTHYVDRISTLFLEHTVAISEIYTRLNEIASQGQLKLTSIQTEPHCWRQFTYGYGVKDILKPDLYVRLTDVNSTIEHLWFIELDRGTSHPSSIKNKAEIYRRYYESGYESKISRVFPRVLWIAPDQPRQNEITTALKQANNRNPGLHMVVTGDQAISVISVSEELN